MGLAAGARVGPYEVVAPLGAGGMGEVYRANDGKLDRDVALKVLPAATAGDPEAIARFEREARAVAALSHPNILAIHDFGRDGETAYAAMELLDGETLRNKLEGGPLPLRRALEVARQVAAGLAAAHERGIVHRDLKPENLFVLRDGRVKILDFGLAKQAAPGGASEFGANTPTRSISTEPGVVMGTAGYMAPEQVRGLPADARSDLFAFGAVLYELLSGVQAFRRATAADTMSAILREEPPEFPAAGGAQFPALERIIRRCLEKDPVARFHSASDLAFALDSLTGATGAVVASGPPSSRARERGAWLFALLACALLAAWSAVRLRPRPAVRPITAALLPPSGAGGQPEWVARGFALSPDGRALAFAAGSGRSRAALWIRELDSPLSRRLEGTEGAELPFWSPEGGSVGFFANAKLKTIPAAGGPVTTLADAGQPSGGAWLPDGTIIFAPSRMTPLTRVASRGGETTPLFEINLAKHETTPLWPAPLPGGRQLLFYATGAGTEPGGEFDAIHIATADGPGRRLLLRERGKCLYSSGHLLFLRRKQLFAQPFDVDRMRTTGEARLIRDRVADFSVVANGTLVYQAWEEPARSVLAWYDTAGHRLAVVGEFDLTRYDSSLRLSPDGRALLLATRDPEAPDSQPLDLWRYDLASGVKTPVLHGAPLYGGAAWGPRSDRLYLSLLEKAGGTGLYEKGLPDEEPVPLYRSASRKLVDSVAPDGRSLIFTEWDPGGDGSLDLFALPLTGERRPVPWLKTRQEEQNGQASPDGKWLAYESYDAGELRLFVGAYPGPGDRRQLSRADAMRTRWRPDGGGVYYLSAWRDLMTVDVRSTDGKLAAGAPRTLFSLPDGTELQDFDPSPDRRRILVQSFTPRAPPPLTLVTDWNAGASK